MLFIKKCIHELNRHIRDLFGFSKAETNGVVVLLILLWIVITLRPAIRWYHIHYHQPNYATDRALLNATLAALTAADSQPAPLPTKEKPLQTTIPNDIGTDSADSIQDGSVAQLDINHATAIALEKLPAISPTLAQRIVKYRHNLGGFVRKEQYKEVYGLTKKALASMEKFTYIVPNYVPTQLDINQADFKTLLRHPYLSYELVQQIMRLRQRSHGFNDINQLQVSNGLDSLTFERIKPYLKITPAKRSKNKKSK